MWEFGSGRRHTCLHSLSTWHVRPGQIKLPWERPGASPQMRWCGSSQGRQAAIAERAPSCSRQGEIVLTLSKAKKKKKGRVALKSRKDLGKHQVPKMNKTRLRLMAW